MLICAKSPRKFNKDPNPFICISLHIKCIPTSVHAGGGDVVVVGEMSIG